MIPIGGPAASALFETVFAPVLEARRRSWFQALADDVDLLMAKMDDVTPASLRDNALFVTAVTHATTIAARNHREEKLDALRAGVLNIAAGTWADETQAHMFLSWIDAFTHIHLFMLGRVASETRRTGARKTETDGSTKEFVRQLLDSPIYGSPEILRQVLRDLEARGLVEVRYSPAASTQVGSVHLIKLGEQFLDFTQSPV